MNVYETHAGMYQFRHLPGYASFLLKHHVDAFTKEQISMSRAVDVPLLKFLSHFSEEELFALSRQGVVDLLNSLSGNNIKEHILHGLKQWVENQIPFLKRLDIEARDITLINYIRGKSLKNFLKLYTSDIDMVMALNQEIDDLVLGYNTTSADVYLEMLKEQIEAETHFSRNVINASPGLTFVYSVAEKRELFITGKIENVSGFTAEEVLNMPNMIAQLTHPDDVNTVSAFMDNLVADKEGKTYQADYRFKTKTGNYEWMRCYAVVYKRDAAGKASEILGVAYEITNEKETAIALQKREKQLLEAQEIGQIGSYEWNLVEDTSESTPQLRKIFEADGRQSFEQLLQRIHPADKQKVKTAIEESLKSGVYNCEFRYKAPSGEKTIDANGLISYDDEGKPLSLIGTIQDVTHRKKIELDLLTQRAELERSNEDLQQFAYVASHDLKEPLRKITMFCNMILDSEDNLSEKNKLNFSKIIDASSRLQSLINGILSYASLETKADKSKCSLEQALQDALSNLELKIQEKKAVIQSDSLPEIWGYPLQLQQLFQNLIANSLKFSKENVSPKISILHSISGDQDDTHQKRLTITYIDNGIGFNNEFGDRIFKIFQRLHTKSQYEGSGVGLAICRKIVEAHGGSISAIGDPGVGASFIINLPLSHE